MFKTILFITKPSDRALIIILVLMEMSEKGIHRLLILLQLMVVLGHVQHLIGVDNVEVAHEQHLGEEDGNVAGLLGLVDHAGVFKTFLSKGKVKKLLLASVSRCSIRKRELNLQRGSIGIRSQGFLCRQRSQHSRSGEYSRILGNPKTG